MDGSSSLLESLGGEEGCRRLSAAFYRRVGKDPALKPLFPGKTLRCATEEFAAFLIQFLGGDEKQTQHRWWLSLRESHARFEIGAAERSAWLTHMRATVEELPLAHGVREELIRFFTQSSGYVIGKDSGEPSQAELGARWAEQRALDDTVAAIAGGCDEEGIALAQRFAGRSSVFVGLLARMMQTGRAGLVAFVREAVERDPALVGYRFSDNTLLNFAAGAGCLRVVATLLRLGVDADVPGRGGHPPLYNVANECSFESGPALAKALIAAGARVNAQSGVTRATALHMAARRGHLEIARALLDCGASLSLRDSKGDTALQRAINCRRREVAELLRQREFGR